MRHVGAVAVLGILVAVAGGCSGPDEGAAPPGNVASGPVTGLPAPGSGPGSPLVPFSATGDLWVLDAGGNSVLRASRDGQIQVELDPARIAEVTGEPDVSFDDCGIAFDPGGTAYFTEAAADAILRYAPDGTLTRLVSRDQILAHTGQETADPEGLTIGEDGRLYVLADNAARILAVDPSSGALSDFVDAEQIMQQTGLADIDLGSTLVAGAGRVVITTRGLPTAILAVTDGPVVKILASGAIGDVDGALTRDTQGELVAVDRLRNTIRRLGKGGELLTLLTKVQLDAGFGGAVQLGGGAAFDAAGTFFVTDDATGSIAWFAPDGTGSVWIGRERIESLTSEAPVFAAVAFAPAY